MCGPCSDGTYWSDIYHKEREEQQKKENEERGRREREKEDDWAKPQWD